MGPSSIDPVLFFTAVHLSLEQSVVCHLRRRYVPLSGGNEAALDLGQLARGEREAKSFLSRLCVHIVKIAEDMSQTDGRTPLPVVYTADDGMLRRRICQDYPCTRGSVSYRRLLSPLLKRAAAPYGKRSQVEGSSYKN